MTKIKISIVALAIAAVAVPVIAGGKDYKCKAATQECLDKMAAKLKTRGWVGIEMEQDEETGTLTINRVVPGSPAEAAGFQTGDVLKAMNGIAMAEENEEKLQVARKEMTPGAKVSYTVDRAGQDVEVPVELGELPQEVLAQWVGMHMLAHSKVEIAAK